MNDLDEADRDLRRVEAWCRSWLQNNPDRPLPGDMRAALEAAERQFVKVQRASVAACSRS